MANIISKSKIYTSILLISAFFSCACIQQQENNHKRIKFKYCTVFYQFEKRETDILEISLKSNGDYKINGEKYPPIKLSLLENNNLNIKPLKLTAKGLTQNTILSWNVLVTNQNKTKKEVIDASLDTIICHKDKCIIENNKFKVKLYF